MICGRFTAWMGLRSADLLDRPFEEGEAFGELGLGQVEGGEEAHDVVAAGNGQEAHLVESVDHLQAGRLVGGGKGPDRFPILQFDALHEADAAGVADDVGILDDPPLEFGGEPVAGAPDVVGEVVAFDDLEDLERDGRGERRAAESGAMGARSEDVAQVDAVDLVAYPKGSDGKSTPEGLGHGKAVDAEVLGAGEAFEDALVALESAGAEVAALDGVDQQEESVFVAQGAETEQVIDGGRGDAPFALDAFDEDGGGGRGERFASRLEVVEGDVAEAGDEGVEALLHLVLSGGGDAAERPAVERIDGGEDLESAFVVAKLAGELVEAFVGLGARVAEEDLAGGEVLDEGLGETALRFLIVEIGDVDEPPGLFDERLGDLGVGVAEGTDGDAAAKVEITFPADIPDVAACPVAQGEIKAPIAGDDELVEQRTDFGVPVLNDGRLDWNNVSHRYGAIHGRSGRERDQKNGIGPEGVARCQSPDARCQMPDAGCRDWNLESGDWELPRPASGRRLLRMWGSRRGDEAGMAAGLLTSTAMEVWGEAACGGWGHGVG